jgi:germination protein M
MKLISKFRNTVAVGVLTLPLILSGCSTFGVSSSAQIDPPPPDVEAQMLETALAPTDQTSLKVGDKLSTVYLQNEKGLLAPVTLHLPASSTEEDLNTTLDMLVDGGSYSSLIPVGFKGVLPKGTEVDAVTIKKDEKLAVVEFNKMFSNYPVADERKILEAITWTLTGNPEIQNVQLWVDGEKLNEMPVDGTPLDRPLNRSLGINLDHDSNSSLSGTSAVTVYFSAETEGGVQYYVPVTRFVPSGGDLVKSALAELIKGPSQGMGLERVLTDNSAVNGVTVSNDGIVTVSINDDMFDVGEKPPAQMMQSVVLTVTENAKGDKVRIWLNGQKDVVGLDNQNYSEPVSQPELINQIPL